MSESSLLNILPALGLGGSAVFFLIAGLIMVGLTFFLALIILESYNTSKESARTD